MKAFTAAALFSGLSVFVLANPLNKPLKGYITFHTPSYQVLLYVHPDAWPLEK